MSLKHKLKLAAREGVARVLFHSGLHALLDRLMPRRLVILAGHCVSAPSNASLPKDMKIAQGDLELILSWFAARYEVVTVGAGVRKLSERGRRSLFALSMDDGYRDNRTHLLPLLQRLKLGATIYLESRPLDERRLTWTHKFFWTLDRIGAERFVAEYLACAEDAHTRTELGLQRATYHLKRVLKYQAPVTERTRIVDELFALHGGDERALCEELYLDWDDVRELARCGVELGGHTLTHEILARLDRDGAQAEIAGSKRALEAGLGAPIESFAYPFGRRWDYDHNSVDAARAAGFASATNTHAGTNNPHSDRYQLRRVMIDADAQLHLLVAEACGGFDLLRKLGLELGE